MHGEEQHLVVFLGIYASKRWSWGIFKQRRLYSALNPAKCEKNVQEVGNGSLRCILDTISL